MPDLSLVLGEKRKRMDPDAAYNLVGPDLAIEVEVTHWSVDRLSIYATLGVPEVWRFAEGKGAFLLLQKGGYVEGPSLSFPGLMAADLVSFLNLHKQTDNTTLVRQFRAWVRQRIADGWK